MNMLSTIGNFLLSEWLWNITRDWYHIPIAMLLCGISFRWVLRLRIIPSILLAMFSVLYSFFIFSVFIVGVLLYFFDFSYNATSVADYFYASFYLGLIYTFLQATFYFIVHQWYRLNMPGIIIVTFLCNGVASILAYYKLSDPLL